MTSEMVAAEARGLGSLGPDQRKPIPFSDTERARLAPLTGPVG